MPELPTGTVTFLFTDLEGSTRLWEDHPDAMRAALARHDEILRDAVEKHDGHVVKTTGDGLHAAFGTAHDAVAAAIEAQRGLGAQPWTLPDPLLVRMGVHTGEADLRGGDYYGTAVNRAARISGAAHGGQVVVSHATEELARDRLSADVTLDDLGEHHLRDLARPERVFQVHAPGLREDFPPLRSLDAFPGNLPTRATSFIGRERELAKISDALREVPMVTLTGVGGVGKTRLAVQAAAQVLPHYADGAWLCELATADGADTLTQVIASSLAVPSRSGMDLAESVVEYLRTKHLLLVLDNCEHLLDAAGDLAERIVETCPHVCLLATSREGLAVDGEQVIPLRSLGLPGADTATDAIEATDAVQLFIERARAAQADFSVATSDLPAIAEVCRRLDGMPLAIELAAARAVAMSPSEIASLLDERFRLLTGGRRSAVERHQTLRATVDWSYELLAERERLVFDRLGVFAGTFDGTAATAVVSGEGIERFDVLDALTDLVAKSMVVAERTDDGTTRYHLLETLRQYAREQVDGTGVADDWRRRHAEHFAGLAEELGAALRGSDEVAARLHLLADLDNFRAAVTWALDRTDEPDAQLGLRIVAGLFNEAALRRSTGIAAWAHRSMDRADLMTEGQLYDIRCAVAWDLFQRGDPGGARALALLTISEGAPTQHSAHMCAATSAAQFGDIDTALAIYAAGIDLLRDGRGDDYSAAALYSGQAMSLAQCGRFEEASVAGEQARVIARRLGNPTALVLALHGLGWSLTESDPSAARAALEESIALSEQAALEGGLDAMLGMVAPLRFRDGDVAQALDALCATVARMRETGERASVINAIEASVTMRPVLGEREVPAVIWGSEAAETFGPRRGLGSPAQARLDATVAELRSTLGDAAFDAAVARGAAMSDEEALNFLLDELTRVRASLPK
jgi:predicted ATPase/class 3 adenylate cyclase